MKYEPEPWEKMFGKPDWKQHLPVYGVYQVIKDDLNDKPTVLDGGLEKKLGTLVHLFYQAISVNVAVYGFYQLAKRLL